MERLTEPMIVPSTGEIFCYRLKPGVSEWKLKNKLGAYETEEEQGLLLRLPCKVGDTVYKLWYKPCHKGEDHPDTYSCCGCEDKCDIERTIYEFTVPNLDWILTNMKYFGDLVWFLTKAEAEKALAEMR